MAKHTDIITIGDSEDSREASTVKAPTRRKRSLANATNLPPEPLAARRVTRSAVAPKVEPDLSPAKRSKAPAKKKVSPPVKSQPKPKEVKKKATPKKKVTKAKEDKPDVVSKYFSPQKAIYDIPSTSRGVENDESEEDDWEEVEDAPMEDSDDALDNYHPVIPEEGVSVEIEAPAILKKKEKKKKDWKAARRLKLNRKKKALQINLHKGSFMCLLSRGFYLNSLNLNPMVKALALSHIPFFRGSDNLKEVNLSLVSSLMNWYRSRFSWIPADKKDKRTELEKLHECLMTTKAASPTTFILGFLTMLRTLDCRDRRTRIIYPISPLPHKADNLLLSDKQLQQRKKSTSPKEKKKETNKKPVGKGKSKKVLSSDSDEDIFVEAAPKKRYTRQDINAVMGLDETSVEVWIEVFLTSDNKWICVDPVNGIIDKPKELEMRCANDLTYVIAFDMSSLLKDVSQRYNSKYVTADFRKLRINDGWFEDTLELFRLPFKTKEEIEEDKQLAVALSLLPIPNTIGAFKDHPLYALKKHLLKYQVIYPPEAPTVGFFKGDPIYPRDCVRITHTRNYWLREARIVKLGEEPYKISTALPKWDKYAKEVIKDQPQHLFGFWQTEPYIPPTAQDGKVPRNEYGNVELFKPCMLPGGTVHIKLPGLLRIANKLNIDCVPAIVGFDAHSGGTHPVCDGFVVCEEFKEVLLAAYDEEQENTRKREEAKREKRVFGNWRRLVRGLMIRERLKARYGTG